MQQAKARARADLRERRNSLSDEQIRAWSQAICERIAASKPFLEADLLLLYAPIGKEINLLPLVRIARERGVPVAFPVCDPETCTLTFRLLETDKRLNAGAYRIPEPPADAPLAMPTARSLCVLPGLSFTPEGARIGYGKGYYDRFLEEFPGVAVGAVYEALLAKKLPTESHDRNALLVFTEKGVIDCQRHRQKKKKSAFPALTPYIQKAIAWLRSLQPTKEDMTEISRVRTLHLPPALVLCSFLFLILARLVDTALLKRGSAMIGAVLLQILIFVVPSVLYSALRGEKFTKRIRLTPPKLSHLWFCFCILAVMITGSMLTSILTGGIDSLSGGFVLYNTFSAQSSGDFFGVAALVIAYALVPAFCEELVFRAYLCAEYEHLGVAISITASSLFFAMLHFSFPLLLTYLFLGALLAAVLYATRSFFAVFALHFCYNLFCLFGQPYLSAFYVHAGTNDIFLFCIVTLFLLFAAFAAGEARKIYHLYARANLSSAYTTTPPMRRTPQILFRALASPVTAACIAIWIVMSLINL